MRGLKAKTMRRVAREAGLPVERDYRAQIHTITVENPAYKPGDGSQQYIQIKRVTCVLGRCQKQMVNFLKKRCPKSSFFGMTLGFYRNGGKGLVIPTPEAAR